MDHGSCPPDPRLDDPAGDAAASGLPGRALSERAGVFDIGLEGKMLIAAFFSAAVADHLGLGLDRPLAGIAASHVLSGIHGLASITFRGNQLISGVAINFLAAGLTVVIAQTWFQQGGRTPRSRATRALTTSSCPVPQAASATSRNRDRWGRSIPSSSRATRSSSTWRFSSCR
jgi:ABC-type uncharacterized transport system permease subunit